MSWAVGENHGRDVGYGVPAWCDFPGCWAEIDRGISYCCGSDAFGGEHGCGLFFCGAHLHLVTKGRGKHTRTVELCSRCYKNRDPFRPTPDRPEWLRHKWTDESWAAWRAEQPPAEE